MKIDKIFRSRGLAVSVNILLSFLAAPRIAHSQTFTNGDVFVAVAHSPGSAAVERDEGLPLWRPRKDFSAPFYLAERTSLRQRQLQEYRRLLYVALTRAQDRLYVCGWETQRPAREAPSWHTLCQAGWSGSATPYRFDSRPLIGVRDGWSGDALRLSAVQTGPPSRDRPPAAMRHTGPMPIGC